MPSIFSSLDNSDWMRNGDFAPTRLEAQQEASQLICGAKTQSNPENTVGALAMAGTRYRLELGRLIVLIE